MLLEDYTGQRCANCPGAAEVATSLQEKYGDDLIVISVHAGHFAKTDKDFPTSYTTTAGNDWNNYLVGTDGLYPNGTVNRKDYTGSGIMSKETKWATLTALAFNDPFVIDLVLDKKYNTAARSLDVTVKGIFRTAFDKRLMISVVLLEDSVIGRQLDKPVNPSILENYVFNHMLRDDLNGSWGTEFSMGKSAGDSVVVKFADNIVDEKFNEKHLTVVAFVFDSDTREVIEAENIKVSSGPGENDGL